MKKQFWAFVFCGYPYEIDSCFCFLFGVKIAEESSQESKLEFTEDEETLITRMYNLVGER